MPEEDSKTGQVEVGLALATVKDAAKQLDIPVTFLQREVKEGRVPSMRMGRRVRVNVMAVSAALNRQAAGEYADSLFGQLPAPAVPETDAPASEENEAHDHRLKMAASRISMD